MITDEYNYSTELGDYILGQNPYARVDTLVKPNLPRDSAGHVDPQLEVPNDHTYPDPSKPIPDVLKAGVLRDYHAKSHFPNDKNVPFGISFPFGIDTGRNTMYMEDHNVVKMLLLRYELKDRKKDPPLSGNSNAYLIVCYSGGDT